MFKNSSMLRMMCVLVGMFASIGYSVYAQTLVTDDGSKHWETDFRAGLNTDGYQFDLGIAYFPIQYIGVKAQIGASGEIEEFEDWGRDESETYHNYAVRFKFTPALSLRTPRLMHWKNQGAGFYLFVDPGVILSPGARGSKNAECVNWDYKCGINLQIDEFIFTIGYGVTNFALYSGYPINHNGQPDNDKYMTHSGFIGGAYKF